MTTSLQAFLVQKIRDSGPLTVEEYMEACLYHPEHGYYTRGLNFLARDGEVFPRDFVTAPHITPLFGQTLARWVQAEYVRVGRPNVFVLMECGPGSGRLMADMLDYLAANQPATYAAARPMLVEASPALTLVQQRTLARHKACVWRHAPTGEGAPIVLIANELLDAFPHSQIVQHEGRIGPRHIGLNEAGDLAFTVPAAGSAITEHAPQMRLWLQALPQNVKAAAFLDYGAETEGPTGDTFQALNRHQKVSVFYQPGETDLTMHVNFAQVVAALKESHPQLVAAPLEELAPFLLRQGLASLALQQGVPTPDLEAALHRLLHPSQMGTLFKVLVLQAPA